MAERLHDDLIWRGVRLLYIIQYIQSALGIRLPAHVGFLPRFLHCYCNIVIPRRGYDVEVGGWTERKKPGGNWKREEYKKAKPRAVLCKK
jgi:hypothetical protein